MIGPPDSYMDSESLDANEEDVSLVFDLACCSLVRSDVDDEPAAVAADDEDDVFAEPTVVPRGSRPTAARPHPAAVDKRRRERRPRREGNLR